MDNYDMTERIFALIFYLEATTIFSFIAYSMIRRRYQLRHLGYKLLLIFLIIGIVFNTLWVISVFFPSGNLTGIVFLLAIVLLPWLWLFGSLGIMFYGLLAIINRKTYVNFPLLPAKKTEGVIAAYFGIIWIIAGLMMLLMEAWVIGLGTNSVEYWFSSLGEILAILVKPLELVGLMPAK